MLFYFLNDSRPTDVRIKLIQFYSNYKRVLIYKQTNLSVCNWQGERDKLYSLPK